MAYVHLHGHLGRDPEFRRHGESVCCQFQLSDRAYLRPRQGEQESPAQWYRVEVWGRRAEALASLLSKGKEVMVHGQQELRRYRRDDGSEGFSVVVRNANVELLGRRSGGEESTSQPVPAAPFPAAVQPLTPMAVSQRPAF
jgi:single-strand DNA-binding protein